MKDVVEYTSLIPGREYTMEGQLVKKSDGKTVVATAKKTFTADKSGNGTVELTFTVDASKLAGERLVAFETRIERKCDIGYGYHALRPNAAPARMPLVHAQSRL